MPNRKLQYWRHIAHEYFDPLWQYRCFCRGKFQKKIRRGRYRWLAKKMGIKKEDCHMGKFNIQQCKKVVEICTDEYAKNEKLIKFAERDQYKKK